MTSLQLPTFDDTSDKWKAYLIRAEAYFEANAITDSKQQRALLVAALSTQTVQVLAGRIAPRTPNSLTYDEAVAALNSYYDPKRHEIAESYKFFTRCQQEGEAVRAFLVEIRRIADGCNFGSALDRMLRDRIVCGVRSTNLRKQLLAKKDLTLEEAEALAIAAETAENDANDISGAPPTVLRMQASHRSSSRDTSGAAQECGRCGSTKHDDNACRWANARCFRCRQRGHLAKKCYRARTDENAARRTASVKTLTVETASRNENKDEAHIWTLISGRKNGLEPPLRRTFRWGEIDLDMEVDTGSPVCVISRNVYDRHRAQWPRLKSPHVKLSCYAGQLPVLGELELPVQFKNVSVTCPLVVLDCSGPSLCGRDLIAALGKTGVTMEELTAPDSTTGNTPSDHMADRPKRRKVTFRDASRLSAAFPTRHMSPTQSCGLVVGRSRLDHLARQQRIRAKLRHRQKMGAWEGTDHFGGENGNSEHANRSSAAPRRPSPPSSRVYARDCVCRGHCKSAVRRRS
ncbi:uncharacterized protein LOC144124701 isoform X2 [Amblyomma americanum]